MLVRTITEEVTSTCYTLKFDNIRDYCKILNYLYTPFFLNSTELINVFGKNGTNCEIDIELADTYIKTFVSNLKKFKGIEADFIMTQDLEAEPEFVFNKKK